jgi:transglutaminase-like putative cysteine protease
VAPQGPLRLSSTTLIQDSGEPDPYNWYARESPVGDLPQGSQLPAQQPLLRSRSLLKHCGRACLEMTAPGWNRVQAICNWVNSHVAFNYQMARPLEDRLDVYTERVGVCRDFQHLAITFCRALNIPARYATGYLGDIGVPVVLPMDFSAWFEAWLDGRWWTFDARNNQPRIGRILMATGRDAADVAITTSFGQADLRYFFVVAEEEAAAPANDRSPRSDPASRLLLRRLRARSSLRASPQSGRPLLAFSAILWKPPSLSTLSGV